MYVVTNHILILCQICIHQHLLQQWAAPTFVIPKKDGKVRFVSDFRELNKRLVRNPYPLPKIQDLMLKLEGFQYASALDLNMGYYHIHLTYRKPVNSVLSYEHSGRCALVH